MASQLSRLPMIAISAFILLTIITGFIFGTIYIIRLLLKIIKLKQPKIIIYYVMMIMCIFIVPLHGY